MTIYNCHYIEAEEMVEEIIKHFPELNDNDFNIIYKTIAKDYAIPEHNCGNFWFYKPETFKSIFLFGNTLSKYITFIFDHYFPKESSILVKWSWNLK